MSDGGEISRREQLRALVRVARYRPVFTAAIIGAGVFAATLEAVGLSFILPIVEIVQSPGDPAAEADGVLGAFVAGGVSDARNSIYAGDRGRGRESGVDGVVDLSIFNPEQMGSKSTSNMMTI